ncbi:MAG: hypothetical protein M1444_00330 [Patescibacteria group bacterium]|nr:hypothetical protein [Patescibacteria group bacterium]
MSLKEGQPSVFQKIATFTENHRARASFGLAAFATAIALLGNPSPVNAETQENIEPPKTDTPATIVWGPGLENPRLEAIAETLIFWGTIITIATVMVTRDNGEGKK